jgi:drug/metabolite transporter (DMT)-like permease
MLGTSAVAPLWMFLGGVCFTAMGAIVKLLAVDVPLPVIVAFRMSVALLLMTPWLLRAGVTAVRTRRSGALLARSVFGALSLVLYVYALAALVLADAVALSFTSPLWAMPIAALVLREAMPRARWIATLIGFVGVLILVRPTGDLHIAMAAGLASAAFTALANVMTRQLSDTEPPNRIVFYYGLYGTIASVLPAWLWWQTPSADQLVLLIAIGVLAVLGQVCGARAFAGGPVTVLAPIDFFRLPMGALIGFFVFAEIPSIWTFVGGAVIAASTLTIVRSRA